MAFYFLLKNKGEKIVENDFDLSFNALKLRNSNETFLFAFRSIFKISASLSLRNFEYRKSKQINEKQLLEKSANSREKERKSFTQNWRKIMIHLIISVLEHCLHCAIVFELVTAHTNSFSIDQEQDVNMMLGPVFIQLCYETVEFRLHRTLISIHEEETNVQIDICERSNRN